MKVEDREDQAPPGFRHDLVINPASRSRSRAPGREREKDDAEVVQVFEAARTRPRIDWAETWRYRELVFFLAWRDVQVRYKQTVLGGAWALLQPLLSTIVFTLFFGRLAGLEARTAGTPYPLFVFAGLLPWTLFANSIACGAKSLVGNSSLVTKVYFPRLVIPISAMGSGLVDFAVSFVVLLGMMAHYGAAPSWSLALAPVFFLGVVLFAVGVGACLAALTVSYRDFPHVVPFLVQIWMFVTPIIYPSTLVPERWRWLFNLNPAAGLIDGLRAALLGLPLEPLEAVLSLVLAGLTFRAGVSYFQVVERRFADVI